MGRSELFRGVEIIRCSVSCTVLFYNILYVFCHNLEFVPRISINDSESSSKTLKGVQNRSEGFCMIIYGMDI